MHLLKRNMDENNFFYSLYLGYCQKFLLILTERRAVTLKVNIGAAAVEIHSKADVKYSYCAFCQ